MNSENFQSLFSPNENARGDGVSQEGYKGAYTVDVSQEGYKL